MYCSECNKKLKEKPYFIIPNLIPNKKIHLCNYKCYHKYNKSNKIPKNMWFQNGYGTLFHPINITNQNKKFEYLTLSEINELDDIQKEKFYLEKEKNDLLNPFLSELYNELYLEDQRISNIEEEYINESYDIFNDPYY